MGRAVEITFADSVAKDPLYATSNEDAYCINHYASRLALSDGASESFDSASWARILAEGYAATPSVSEEWLRAATASFSSLYARQELSWSKQASFDRGSFATLLGLEVIDSSVELLAIGDSICVLVDTSQVLRTFPYSHSAQFRERPQLCSTVDSLNRFVHTSDFFLNHTTSWVLDGLACPQLLCMTDALGEWFLRSLENESPEWTSLLSLSSREEFSELVTRLKAERAMRIDDATFIRISL